MGYPLLGKFFVFFIAAFLLLFVYISLLNTHSTWIDETKINVFAEEQLKNIENHVDKAGNTKNEDIIISKIEKDNNTRKSVNVSTKQKENNNTNLKYILQWTPRSHSPFVYMGKGQEVFIKYGCKYTNCFVTADASYLGDITKFDVVAFNGPDVRYMKRPALPQKRSPHQKYVFGTIESSHYYPVYDSIFDGYFNWTWTFKLDSDSKWGYIVVRNEEGKIIGPKKEMHWMKTEDMKPVPSELLSVLKRKSKAAAWFVSNCYAKNRRETFVKDLQVALIKYDLKIDIYGACGKFHCNRSDEKKCDKLIEDNYFFYLAFENSFSEDYVTEKILHGLQYSAIPIVYGGANYTRFLPDGSYINARELGVKKLAAKMNDLMHNMEEYSSYFRWRSHYSFHKRAETVETNDYCGFCTLLNNEEKVKETTVYENFRLWWNPANFSCPIT